MRWQWMALAVAMALTSACAKKGAGRFEGAPGGIPVVYDGSVPADQREALNEDISRLASMNISDTTDAKVMGVTSFSAAELSDWLRTRLKYITGQTFNVKANTVAQQTSYYYNPETFADRSASIAAFDEQKATVTRMTNIGAAVYLDGMNDYQLSALKVAGEEVLVTSPRVGIFQVGEGLFANAANRSAVVQSLDRLGTLFHEARHTDGNGMHVAFAHQVCPSWHDYTGSYACDNATNGPYAIQAVLLKKFASVCTDCDSRDKETLALLVADRVSRLLPGRTEKDPTPERVKK